MRLAAKLFKNKIKPGARARIAVYDSLLAQPLVVDLAGQGLNETIDKLATKTYHLCKEQGGGFPYVVIKEVVENLIHAFFSEAVVSILDNGNTIRISDQGPGIKNKPRAFAPGFTTATAEMKQFIRGVGSGLPVAKELMSFSGGQLELEDNLSGGTVVTLRAGKTRLSQQSSFEGLSLSKRQARVLSLIVELGQAGPSAVSSELSISLATSHRELSCLGGFGLVKSDPQGKRVATALGQEYLNRLLGAKQ